jgi:hypothetical protein
LAFDSPVKGGSCRGVVEGGGSSARLSKRLARILLRSGYQCLLLPMTIGWPTRNMLKTWMILKRNSPHQWLHGWQLLHTLAKKKMCETSKYVEVLCQKVASFLDLRG